MRQPAGPLLGAVFVAAGLDVLENPRPTPDAAQPFLKNATILGGLLLMVFD